MNGISTGGGMNLSETKLLALLQGNQARDDGPRLYLVKKGEEGYLSPADMAHLYISAALLITIMDFLQGQLWLKTNEDEERGVHTSYTDFLTPFFSAELAPVLFLRDYLINSGADHMKEVQNKTLAIEAGILSFVIASPEDDRRLFLVQSLVEMTVHFLHEENEQAGRPLHHGHKGLQLYRTFDNLDRVFDLDYGLDTDMEVDLTTTERLYQRAGLGVQSGYSTILLALHGMRAERGSRVVDLGSGYGRVGLVFALLRPDMKITGYEYVPHRVDVSNRAAESLGLQDSLHYAVQDLSSVSFSIPDADVYYMYDPFSDDTYRHVLEQLVAVSKSRAITIVTKGEARGWLTAVAEEEDWLSPQMIDYGNLCIFRS
jgi:hypothetical protein